jgi:hypothetical protein
VLKQIEENYKYLMILLLVVYLINTAYLKEITITFTAIALAIILEIIKQRHHIKKLTYSQLAIIGIVVLAGISGTIYIVILFQIFLQSLSIPQTLETVLLLLTALVCFYLVGYFLKKLYARAIGN